MTYSKNYRTRIKGDERSEMAGKMAALYTAGSSIRAIADHYGRSYGWTRVVLLEMGVQMRTRSGTRAARKKSTAAVEGGRA
ncbi:helix-turn-helix domain-containing protein [Streptomyces sp. PA03-1a]|nr:helix-turn-helix domain-containing protein [Streptomyces sp. PA03-1a]MDX2813352.1 helix-turn-helix domain-containing protein [Streptomyces sp. PA03-5A]